jgi:cation transport regulator ChaC
MKRAVLKAIFAAACLSALLFFAFIAHRQFQRGAPVYFFAYGAALDTATMKSRAGGFEAATAASLPGYRLVFQTNRRTEFGVANLAEGKEGRVYGAVYTLTGEQFALLEKSSGSRGFYRQIGVRAELPGGEEKDAVAFVLAGDATQAAPSRPYLVAAANGMKQFGYGEKEMRALSEAAQVPS